MTTTIKLSKKHEEIVNKMKQLESEQGCKLYFMYLQYSDKVHAVKIEEINENGIVYYQYGILCTHNVAMTMQRKGIIKAEEIGILKDGTTLNLCSLNV